MTRALLALATIAALLWLGYDVLERVVLGAFTLLVLAVGG